MKVLYLFGMVAAVVFCAYYSGRALGMAKCWERVAAQNVNMAIVAQRAAIAKERKIDEQVYNIGTADIRRVLRERYTIAE